MNTLQFEETPRQRKNRIKSFVLAHRGKMDTYQMAEKLGVRPIEIAARLAWITKGDNAALGDKKFHNDYTPSKNTARAIMTDAIAATSLLSGAILSLPSYTCELEFQLVKKVSKKFEFDLVEYKPSTYRKMLKKVDELKLGRKVRMTYKGNMGDMIARSRKNEYSHLVLDYCGMVSTFASEIAMAMENKIVKRGGLILLTLANRSNKWGSDFMAKYGDTVLDAITKFITEVGGNSYKIQQMHPYRSEDSKGGKRGANMVLIAIKRIR